MRRALLVGLAAALLGACSSGTTASTTTRAATTSITTSATSGPTTTGGPVTFQGFTVVKAGGVAGIYRAMTVNAEGALGSSDSPNRDPVANGKNMSPADFSRLTTLVLGPSWATLGTSYGVAVPDGFTYSLAPTPGQSIDVASTDNLPPLLAEVIEIVERYIDA